MVSRWRIATALLPGIAWGLLLHAVYLLVLCALPFEPSGAARLGEGTLRGLGQ